jgi:hypothetical protein
LGTGSGSRNPRPRTITPAGASRAPRS